MAGDLIGEKLERARSVCVDAIEILTARPHVQIEPIGFQDLGIAGGALRIGSRFGFDDPVPLATAVERSLSSFEVSK